MDDCMSYNIQHEWKDHICEIESELELNIE